MKQQHTIGNVGLSAQIPVPMYDELKSECSRLRISVADATRDALSNWLAKQKRQRLIESTTPESTPDNA